MSDLFENQIGFLMMRLKFFSVKVPVGHLKCPLKDGHQNKMADKPKGCQSSKLITHLKLRMVFMDKVQEMYPGLKLYVSEARIELENVKSN